MIEDTIQRQIEQGSSPDQDAVHEKEDAMKRELRQQRGFTLAEILVAVTIFIIIMVAALSMYDRQNKVFKSGVESSNMQQNSRVAFDRMVADLRMAGFDFDRDGVPSGTKAGVNFQQQPDEQLEYMGDTAIVTRGNLNFTTGAENGREKDWESNAFPVVTTKNSEIVAYALKSDDDSKNTGTITFYADVAKRREVFESGSPLTGPKERKVIITDVDLTNNNPPYTLYRFTLKDVDLADSVADPADSQPIASGIRSLNFVYYSDTTGTTVVAANAGAGQFDAANPTVAIPERTARATAQAIRINLIGMNEAPDLTYVNTTETLAAAQKFRTYGLSSLIVPRNTGRKGFKEEGLTGPNPPTIKSVCVGSCGVPFLTWAAPVGGAQVDFYTILFDIDPAGSFAGGVPVGNVTSSYMTPALNPGTKYYFKIMASNGYGQAVSVDMIDGTPQAITKPAAPTVLNTSGSGVSNPAQANQIVVTWPIVKTDDPSATTETCKTNPAGGATHTTVTIPTSEVVHYKLYRDPTSGFDPSAGGGTKVFDDTTTPYTVNIGTGTATYVDVEPNCVDYYYRIQAIVVLCGQAGHDTWNAGSTATIADSQSTWFPAIGTPASYGVAKSGIAPKAPAALTGPPPPSPISGPNQLADVALSWPKVTQDMSNATIAVDSYFVYRQQMKPTVGTKVKLADSDGNIALPGSTVTYTDKLAPRTDSQGVTIQYIYSVEATQCNKTIVSADATVNFPLTINYSTLSAPTSITSSAGVGDGKSPGTAFQLATGDSVSFTQTGMVAPMTATVVAVGTFTVPVSAGVGTFSWPSETDGTTYEVDIVTTDSLGRKYTYTIYVTDEPGICSYVAPTPTISVTALVTGFGTLATPYQMKSTDSILVVGDARLGGATAAITENSTGILKTTVTGTGTTTRTIAWPGALLKNDTLYKVDITATQTSSGCQITYPSKYVNQYCNTYSGGAPAVTSTDVVNPGTSASPWSLRVGYAITVTEAKAVKVTGTVLDTVTLVSYPLTTATGVSPITIPWVAGYPNNDKLQVDLKVFDSNGCFFTVPSKFVTQICSYSGGTPTVVSSDPKSPVTDLGTVAKPYFMIPNVDYLTLTETKLASVLANFYDNIAPATLVTSTTSSGTAPTVKVPMPAAGGLINGHTYKVDLFPRDASGCTTASPSNTVYITRKGCGLTPKAVDATVESYTNPNATIKLINNGPVSMTLKTITVTWVPPSGNPKVVAANGFPGGNAITAPFPVGKATTTFTFNVPGTAVQRALAAGATMTFTLNFSSVAADPFGTGSPAGDIYVNYDTTAADGSATNQFCNVVLFTSGNQNGANNPSSFN
jgi:type II secretory pathway component PulJ